MGYVLELDRLSKHFPSHAALDQLTLQVAEGEFFALLGPSGCGKTTTLRLIAGFDEPTHGEIRLRGKRLDGLRPYQRNVSTVFQNYALFPHLTVRGNIEFGLRYSKAASAGGISRIIEMLELGGKEDRFPAQLSGGERQRVALARSLIVRPAVLLLDEPLAALDPNLRKQVRSELKALQRQAGIAFVFVTHDQEEALSLSDRLAVLNHGRLEQVATPRDAYLKPATRFTAAFLGPVNWVDGIGVRPESARVTFDRPDTGARGFSAIVEDSIFLGNCLHIRTRLTSGEPFVAEVGRACQGFANGDQVHIWWEPGDELRLPEQ